MLIVEHSTITGNTECDCDHTPLGGGIASFGGSVTLTNSTISGNSAAWGGGIFTVNSRVKVQNSIIANNTRNIGEETDSNCLSILDTLHFAEGSLSNNDSCGLLATLIADPLLGPLADNGGPSKTHALLRGSPAIDAAPTSSLPVDQCYVTRPQGARNDIGAFEFDDYPRVSLIIDASQAVNPNTGVAIVTGSMTCSEPVTVELRVGLTQDQKAGRVNTTVRATDVSRVSCTGFRYWSVAIAPSSGAFKNGVGAASAQTQPGVPGTPWVTPGAAAAKVKLFWGHK